MVYARIPGGSLDCSPGTQPMVVMGRSMGLSLGTSDGILQPVAGEGDFFGDEWAAKDFI